MLEEIWKDCHLTDKYSISNFGNIFSKITNMKITPCIKQKTYQVSLKIDKKSKHFKLHRLVCHAFDPEFDNGVVKFKNGNPLDITFENLEYKKKIVLENEKWITCYNNINYIISNFGRVKNIKTDRVLKSHRNKDGYLEVRVGSNKRLNRVHRLVMFSFKDTEYFENAVVNHKDGNKLNNNLDNLEWCTITYNNEHAIKNNLNPEFIKYGEEHRSSKLKTSDITYIKEMYMESKNYKKVGRHFGVSDNTVRKIIKGETWSHI